jgi:hypothetical protein
MAETDGMFGMNGWGILIILFFLMSGGFGGFGANNQVATSAEVQRGFDNQNSMANQREILAATNQVYHDIVGFVGDKYSELDRDVLGVSAAVQQGIANQNQCCCNTLRAIDSVKFENAQNTAKILEAMAQNKIEALQSKVAELQLAQATQNVVRYPQAWTYNAGPSPFCGGCGLGV